MRPAAAGGCGFPLCRDHAVEGATLLQNRRPASPASCRGSLRPGRREAATISRVDALGPHRGLVCCAGLRPTTRRNRLEIACAASKEDWRSRLRGRDPQCTNSWGVPDFARTAQVTRPAAWTRAGVDLFTLSKVLRHASVAMTERYTHLTRGDLKAAVNRKPVSESRANEEGRADLG